MHLVDHEDNLDKSFGIWLKAQRVFRNKSVAEVNKESGIRFHRILELEGGSPHRSISNREARLLSAVLDLNLEEVLARVTGSGP